MDIRLQEDQVRPRKDVFSSDNLPPQEQLVQLIRVSWKGGGFGFAEQFSETSR